MTLKMFLAPSVCHEFILGMRFHHVGVGGGDDDDVDDNVKMNVICSTNGGGDASSLTATPPVKVEVDVIESPNVDDVLKYEQQKEDTQTVFSENDDDDDITFP